MIRSLALLVALLPAASADPLAGYAPAGPPSHCVSGGTSASPVIIDRRTVGVRQSGRRWWISRVENCPSLEPLSTLVVERFGGQLCDTDRFRVVTPGLSIPSAYCRFGSFVPYQRVKKP